MGHSTVLVEVDGVRILTDPLVTRRLAHLRRRAPTPTVGPVDAVLISHVHMDHLHLPSLRRTARGARLIVPDGAGRLVRRLPVRSVEEVRHGAIVRVREPATGRSAVDVEVVPAHHLSGRGPHSSVIAPPVGYVVRAAGRAVYFAGDTDLFDSMRALGPLDVALLPIWGWGRTLGERHLNPETAAIATELARSHHRGPDPLGHVQRGPIRRATQPGSISRRTRSAMRSPASGSRTVSACCNREVRCSSTRTPTSTDESTGPATLAVAHRRRLALALAACLSAALFLAACRCQIAVTMTAPTIEPMKPLGRRARPSPASKLTSSPPMNDPANPATRAIPQSSRETDRPNSTCAVAPTSIPKPSIAKISTAVP